VELSPFKVAFAQNLIASYAEKGRLKNAYFEVFGRWNPNSFQLRLERFVNQRFLPEATK